MHSLATIKPRHIPQRTCVACGRKTAKAEMLRLCRHQDGRVMIDVQQRLPGRGAYVCPAAACAQLLVRKKALHHGLRAPVSAEDYVKIVDYIQKHVA